MKKQLNFVKGNKRTIEAPRDTTPAPDFRPIPQFGGKLVDILQRSPVARAVSQSMTIKPRR